MNQPGRIDTKSSESFQYYPNPLGTQTSVILSLPESTRAKLEIYNSHSQFVALLLNEYLSSGDHTIQWQVNDNILSGIYFLQLITGQSISTGKLLLMK
jgi:hypothetical protein